MLNGVVHNKQPYTGLGAIEINAGPLIRKVVHYGVGKRPARPAARRDLSLAKSSRTLIETYRTLMRGCDDDPAFVYRGRRTAATSGDGHGIVRETAVWLRNKNVDFVCRVSRVKYD
ncbi:hypothetical protein EVAR_80112_1 [Eumeta japonica]|uniref:Uncharacterized protein n=1 Tax=Eumeta variegata TaxID=151549 RepID=A0A4C1UD28_EUMVA|nr:hypothetical protein EVAR_80112_1 [Eumeta japonica]